MPAMQQQTLPLDRLGGGGPPTKHRNPTAFVDNMSLPVHRWFRYSAGFSAAWAERIIRDEGASKVLDPFAGSGTAVLAAESCAVNAIGVDVHPFIARVAHAKLMWRADITELRHRAELVIEDANRSKSAVVPAADLVKRCFDPSTVLMLAKLKEAISTRAANDQIDELLWLALVSIIRPCSHAGTAQWQYVLPNKSKARVAEPVTAFRERIDMFARDMVVRDSLIDSSSVKYVEEDARTLASVPDDWADFVVTSPPYANNYDYADAARLEMSVMGEIAGWGDLKPLRNLLVKSCSQQMGKWDPELAFESPLLEPIKNDLKATYEALDRVRREKGGRKAYHFMILGYFLDLAHVWHALRRATTLGARVCYVVGDSAPYGVHVPVEEWLGTLAVASGFNSWSFEVSRKRNIKWKNRKHRVPLHEGQLWIE